MSIARRPVDRRELVVHLTVEQAAEVAQGLVCLVTLLDGLPQSLSANVSGYLSCNGLRKIYTAVADQLEQQIDRLDQLAVLRVEQRKQAERRAAREARRAERTGVT